MREEEETAAHMAPGTEQPWSGTFKLDQRWQLSGTFNPGGFNAPKTLKKGVNI